MGLLIALDKLMLQLLHHKANAFTSLLEPIAIAEMAQFLTLEQLFRETEEMPASLKLPLLRRRMCFMLLEEDLALGRWDSLPG